MEQKSSHTQLSFLLTCQLNQPILLGLGEADQVNSGICLVDLSVITKLCIYSSKHLIQIVFSNGCTPISTHLLAKTTARERQGLSISSAKNDTGFTSPLLFHLFIHHENMCTAIPVTEVKHETSSPSLRIVYAQPLLKF